MDFLLDLKPFEGETFYLGCFWKWVFETFDLNPRLSTRTSDFQVEIEKTYYSSLGLPIQIRHIQVDFKLLN